MPTSIIFDQRDANRNIMVMAVDRMSKEAEYIDSREGL
jgi:hypothetical protein